MAWIDQLMAVGFVFLLLAGAVLALRRRSGRGWFPFGSARRGPDGILRPLARLALTPQHCLHLVEVNGQRVLLATHPGGVSFEPSAARFSDLLPLTKHEEAR